jgi:uncharacterized protein
MLLLRIAVPGNGCTPVERCNWYSWTRDRVLADGIAEEVALKSMPDPHTARESIWLPYMRDKLGADEHSVLVGHSSGAVAALRLCETDKIGGVVLVSACHTGSTHCYYWHMLQHA